MSKIVADTNVLFSFFWKGSITREIITSNQFKIYSPEYAITEILKYKQEIIKKTKITSKEFNEQLTELKKIIIFIPKEEYAVLFKHTADKIKDKNDIDFITLAYFLKTPLWSNDKELEFQNIVTIISTKEIILRIKEKL